MHIKCLPLDIRPYNYDFLVDIAAMDDRVTLELPAKSSLGFKKTAANMSAVEQFLLADTPADAFLISIDMLVYGGLFPARSHQLTEEQMTERLSIIQQIKLKHPNTKIYCSSLILRTPQYNSNEEEPDYYGEYGLRIFTVGYLRDKQQRGGLSAAEQTQLQQFYA